MLDSQKTLNYNKTLITNVRVSIQIPKLKKM